jgi:hypothetical protein
MGLGGIRGEVSAAKAISGTPFTCRRSGTSRSDPFLSPSGSMPPTYRSQKIRASRNSADNGVSNYGNYIGSSWINGGGGRTRTSDTGLMRPLLCHLSYAAVLGARAENLQVRSAGVKRAGVPSVATVPEIVPVSLRATSWRSPGLTMWYRSNTALAL